MECPCTKDCPDRNVTCRLECTAWKEYEKERNREYDKRTKEFELKSMEYELNRNTKKRKK